ncbi:MAG: response regulator, partial [Desulfatirhabdiaceae bacterium]
MTETPDFKCDVAKIGPAVQVTDGIPTEKALRILCMDDDPAMARLLQKHLSRTGHEVKVAHDGMTGLSMHRQEAFDFLIIDYRMPDLTGIDVLRELARNSDMPPSVILTAAGDEKTAVEAMKLGASDYILKDSDSGYLELIPSVIQRALQQKQLVEAKKAAEDRLRRAHVELEKLVTARTAELVIANNALRE